MIRDHSTHVKFTGSGYRASCMTRGCLWYGQHHQYFRYIGYGQAGALHRAQMLAEDDARRHRQEERRKALEAAAAERRRERKR